jgi:hypothetical protein
MAIYERHGNDDLVRWRISTNPGSAAAWNAVQTGDANPANDGNGNTYANPFYLAVPNRIYSFSRSVGYDPNYSVFTGLDPTNSTALTYSYGGHFIYWMNPNNGVNGANGGAGRPYVKYASNGTDRIWFITTEDHPHNYYNSLYAGYVQFDAGGLGIVRKSDGTIVAGSNGQISTAQTPFPAPANNSAAAIASGTGYSYSPTAFTKIFTGSGNSVASWANDVELDSNGNPAVVFSVRKNNPSDAFVANSLDYYYARWDGAAWHSHRMAYAGSPLYSGENNYAGLAALNPANPSMVFISTNYTPDTDLPLGHWEIYQGLTADGGATWDWFPITSNSTVDNIRPIVSVVDDSRIALAWMRGTYTTYANYNTSVVGLVTTPLVPGDINRDGDVNVSDISAMMAALADLSSYQSTNGLTALQLRQIADLTRDNNVTNADIQGLIDLLANGGGSSSLAAVPEPPGIVLMGTAAFFGMAALLRRFRPTPAPTNRR